METTLTVKPSVKFRNFIYELRDNMETTLTVKPSASTTLLVKSIGKKQNSSFIDMINLYGVILADLENQTKIKIPSRIHNLLGKYHNACLVMSGDELSSRNVYNDFNEMLDVTSEDSLYGILKYLREDLQLPTYQVKFNTYFAELEPLEQLQLITMVRPQNY